MSTTYDQLDSVSKRRIHQSTNRLSQLRTQLFSRKAQQCRERDNSQEVDNEDGRRIDIHSSQDNTRRHADQQDIDIVARQRQPREAQEVGRQPHPRALVLGELLSTAVGRQHAAHVAQAARPAGHEGCVLIRRPAIRPSIFASHRAGLGGAVGAVEAAACAAVPGESSFDAACVESQEVLSACGYTKGQKRPRQRPPDGHIKVGRDEVICEVALGRRAPARRGVG